MVANFIAVTFFHFFLFIVIVILGLEITASEVKKILQLQQNLN